MALVAGPGWLATVLPEPRWARSLFPRLGSIVARTRRDREFRRFFVKPFQFRCLAGQYSKPHPQPMDGAILVIVVIVCLIVAVWAVVFAVGGALAVGALLAQGYLGGTVLRLIGLSLLTLAFLPLGLGAAMVIGWIEVRERDKMDEEEIYRR